MTSPSPLAGRKALVTGGSRGIGAGIARELAAQGAAVAITYRRDETAAETTLAQLREAGAPTARAWQADAMDPEALAGVVDEVAEALGGLDVLVNNAGVFEVAPVPELDLAAFDRVMTVNVRAVFAATRAACAHLGEGGRVVNIGSVNAHWVPFPGLAAYSTSKAAVAALTQALARDLAPRRITVNCVQPGPIDTDMNPADGADAARMTERVALGRYGNAEEIAGLVAFLASERSSYITGACLDVDGGISL